MFPEILLLFRVIRTKPKFPSESPLKPPLNNFELKALSACYQSFTAVKKAVIAFDVICLLFFIGSVRCDPGHIPPLPLVKKWSSGIGGR
jgi:hypothetical protein